MVSQLYILPDFEHPVTLRRDELNYSSIHPIINSKANEILRSLGLEERYSCSTTHERVERDCNSALEEAEDIEERSYELLKRIRRN